MTEPIIIYIKTGYTDAQKRATYKWNEKNREKVNSIRMKSYYRLKEQRTTFLEMVGLIKVFL